MSRIGNKPITVPAGVDVKVEGNTVTVTKDKATLTQVINPLISVKIEDGKVHVHRANEENETKALHGLTRALINDMITGASEGFQRALEIQGVGYRAAKQGSDLVMNLGYSHQVIMPEKPGITIEVPNPNSIIVKGPDKQAVGQFAAEIREKRPPEPYKGKGIRYVGEVVVLKEGKAGKGK